MSQEKGEKLGGMSGKNDLLIYNQRVAGSSPAGSTQRIYCRAGEIPARQL